MIKYIVNADDFGYSKGTNIAIVNAFKEKKINSTSIMVNTLFFEDAINKLSEIEGLNIGLHADFNQGFISLLLQSIFNKKQLKNLIEEELEYQIQKAKKHGIILTHLDSHRHVHMIPLIFKIFLKKAKEHNIQRIRFINENFFYSFRKIQCLFDGGLIKYCVLKFLSFFNKYDTNIYFYSVLYTGKIFSHNILIPEKYKTIEFGHHINVSNIDTDAFDKNILSKNRVKEFELLKKCF